METLEKKEILTQEIRLDEIKPGNNPRKTFDVGTLNELVKSIYTYGVIEPIVVRFISEGHYEIVCGERRWRAAQIAGLETIPARIRDNIDDEDAFVISLVENLQRHNLNAIEEAEGYAKLIEWGYNQVGIASTINRHPSTVSNTLRLRKLPDNIKDLIVGGVISASHGEALLGFVDYPELLDMKLKDAIAGKPTKEIEQVLFNWDAAEKGLMAWVQTAQIGVEAAKQCMKCQHRRNRNGSADGWICLDVECCKE
jgi:ParB/RepB/Spo0J family partition protein